MILTGSCLDILPTLPANSVDSICTDPPYHLTSIVKRFGADGAFARASRGFMGQQWDGGDIAFRAETWAHCLRVLKPGGHLAAFSGTRTYHRMACAIEDAGFEIRDQLAWVYGSGFPKSHDVSKGIDKLLGATPEAAQWEGWGTALKPAWEPIALARKPLDGTVARNVLAHGVGALNIDGCRVAMNGDDRSELEAKSSKNPTGKVAENVPFVSGIASRPHDLGRWPANILHDGEAFGDATWSRFFYCAKASKSDRGDGNDHPTVKPHDLMRWLCRLITPPGGLVLDPFTGSGSTGRAALAEGFRFTGIELSPEYSAIARRRCGFRQTGDLFA